MSLTETFRKTAVGNVFFGGGEVEMLIIFCNGATPLDVVKEVDFFWQSMG